MDGLGVATMVAMLPGATVAVIVASVEAAPPLIFTEHQDRKFITVSVTPLPPSPPSATLPSDPPSVGVVPESVPLELPLEDPLELPLDEPELDPLLEPDPPLELDPPPELLPPSPGVAGAGDELLLHATAPVTARAPMLPKVNQRIPFIVLIMKPPLRGGLLQAREGERLARIFAKSGRSAFCLNVHDRRFIGTR